MSQTGIALVIAIVVIVVLGVAIGVLLASRRKTARIKEHFGPEYERTVAESGDENAAMKELKGRVRERNKLDIEPLAPQARERFAADWRTVQAAFVDNPAGAVGDADRLVADVMRTRGYPVDDFDRRAADISVDHPDVALNYRAAHDIYLLQERDSNSIGTEAQRQAFMHYRALFDRLLESDTHDPEEAHA
jgi:hypothetical protein